jgi:short-subunit dehydrogenase
MEINNSSSQNLTAKNVLITGGSRGIGKAIAMAFAAEGANLFLVSKNENRLSDAVKELKKLFASISIYSKAIDLSTAEGASSIINEVKSVDFSIDILVNNAGHFALVQ